MKSIQVYEGDGVFRTTKKVRRKAVVSWHYRSIGIVVDMYGACTYAINGLKGKVRFCSRNELLTCFSEEQIAAHERVILTTIKRTNPSRTWDVEFMLDWNRSNGDRK